MFRLRPWIPENWFDEFYDYGIKHERKLNVNRRILHALKEDTDKRQISLRIVIFYSQDDFSTVRWREDFLKKTLGNLEIPYFDTKQHLIDLMQNQTLELKDLYYQDNGHPNQHGNKAIAEGIAEWLMQQSSR
jgi:lysophospholipase L1-like esterase